MILDPKALQAKIKQNINQLPVLVDVKFIEQGVEIPGQVYVKKISYTHANLPHLISLILISKYIPIISYL